MRTTSSQNSVKLGLCALFNKYKTSISNNQANIIKCLECISKLVLFQHLMAKT